MVLKKEFKNEIAVVSLVVAKSKNSLALALDQKQAA